MSNTTKRYLISRSIYIKCLNLNVYKYNCFFNCDGSASAFGKYNKIIINKLNNYKLKYPGLIIAYTITYSKKNVPLNINIKLDFEEDFDEDSVIGVLLLEGKLDKSIKSLLNY